MTFTRRLLLSCIAVCLVVLTPSAAQAKNPASTMDEYLSQVVAEAGVPGISAALLRDGDIVHTAAAGVDGNGGMLTADTPMRIESLSKSFTATAVMRLVEAGRIDLDTAVRDYLPEFELADERVDDITVRHLLNQTSGMTDATAPPLYSAGTENLEEAVDRLSEATLAAAPGTEFHYHNPNYHVAARVVEVVSKTPFARYLDEQVFQPLKMDSTVDTALTTDRVDGMARGHMRAYGQPVRHDGPEYFSQGSGGVVSTANDMARWLQIHNQPEENAVVTPESIAAMHEPSSKAADSYGLGWYNAESAEGPPTRVSHTGTGGGFGAYQGVFDESGYSVVVMMNSGAGLTSPEPGSLAQNLLHTVDDEIPALSTRTDHGGADLVLTGIAIVTIGLGVLGLVRSGRWSRRRKGRNRVMTALRLAPALLPVALFLSLPSLQLQATDRSAPFHLLWTVSPVGLSWLGAWAAVCAVLVAARSVGLVLSIRAVRREPCDVAPSKLEEAG